MNKKKLINIDLLNNRYCVIYSHSQLGNTLFTTIEHAKASHIPLLEFDLKKTIEYNNTQKQFPKPIKVFLVVDDDAIQTESVVNFLKSRGHWAEGFSDASLAYHHFFSDPNYYDIILLDDDMPRRTGESIACDIKLNHPRKEVLLLLSSKGGNESSKKFQYHTLSKETLSKRLEKM